LIAFHHVNLSFSGKQIFENLNITINEEEKICFSGPSGRGKSTLLKMLQGYVLPDSGEILINKWSMTPHNIRYIRDSIVWIPQNINLPVNNGLELLKLMHLDENLSQVKAIAKSLLLEEEILSKDFSIISGGQKQRIIIAICLSIDRNILLMDEPTASLDAVSVEALLSTILSLSNKTVISASHNDFWLKNFGKVIPL
jgi:polar amino acid transport system ATP-binding protein/putative ABC transport system ATP-binding protein